MKSKIILSLIIATLIILASFSVASAKNQNSSSESLKNRVKLLTDDSRFNPKKVVLLDFSSVSCCRILNNEYLSSAGVSFDNSVNRGWATYQANKFVNHLSGSPTLPGAPKGITGTRLTLAQNTKMVGMYLQAGSPFSFSSNRPSKSITVKAYNESGNQIFEQITDTCLGEAASCLPKFIGVYSSKPIIKALEFMINEPYSWSIDDLKWQP